MKIFTLLSVVDGTRAGIVCKEWQKHMISNTECIYNDDYVPEHKPWYHIFRRLETGDIIGYSYDSDAQSWLRFDFPYLTFNSDMPCITPSINPNISIYNSAHSMSHGLVCIWYQENTTNAILIFNPILKSWRWLPEGPTKKYKNCVIALSVDTKSKAYYLAVVNSPKYIFESDSNEDVTIEFYDSKKECWAIVYNGSLVGYKGGSQAVICNGILYYLVYGENTYDYEVLPFDLRSKRFKRSLKDMAILLPSDLLPINVKIMNLRDKLVLVGMTFDFHTNKTGISVWELCGTKWHEVSRMPDELSDICHFECSGLNDFIYIHSYDKSYLTILNLSQMTWKLAGNASFWDPYNCTGKIDYELMGFCWQPRFDICP